MFAESLKKSYFIAHSGSYYFSAACSVKFIHKYKIARTFKTAEMTFQGVLKNL